MPGGLPITRLSGDYGSGYDRYLADFAGASISTIYAAQQADSAQHDVA